MKEIISLLTISFIFCGSFYMTFAQTPQSIPYQAVARDASGNLIASQNVSLRFSIHSVTAAGTIVYSETQNRTTNALGLFSVNIGQGTPVTGTFAAINWGSGAKFTQVEIDIAGGSNYVDMGTQQLMSVPYALYAKNAENGMFPGTVAGEMNYWNGSNWVTLPPGVQDETLTFCNGVPSWGPCLSILTTAAITNIGAATATCGGNIISSGTTVTARGVCWSTSANPTIANSFTSNGTGTGAFVSSITGLAANTTYYVRAYATNSGGTSYGNQVNFTTLNITLATLTTSSISNLANYTVTTGGNITNSGGVGVVVTARGICWSTSPNPTTGNSFTSDGTGTGTFVSNISGLTLNTLYYIRAYATNSVGTAYGNQISFTTLNVALPAIGQAYLGGKLAYVLQAGDPGYNASIPHGLIAATTDQASAEWGICLIVSGANNPAIGAGYQNTIAIMNGGTNCGNGFAAKVCTDLVLGGYDNWFLPSTDELAKLYLNRVAIGGFTTTTGFTSYYWSSTDLGSGYAYFYGFDSGGSNYNDTDKTYRVRAIRYF